MDPMPTIDPTIIWNIHLHGTTLIRVRISEARIARRDMLCASDGGDVVAYFSADAIKFIVRSDDESAEVGA